MEMDWLSWSWFLPAFSQCLKVFERLDSLFDARLFGFEFPNCRLKIHHDPPWEGLNATRAVFFLAVSSPFSFSRYDSDRKTCPSLSMRQSVGSSLRPGSQHPGGGSWRPSKASQAVSCFSKCTLAICSCNVAGVDCGVTFVNWVLVP